MRLAYLVKQSKMYGRHIFIRLKILKFVPQLFHSILQLNYLQQQKIQRFVRKTKENTAKITTYTVLNQL